MKKLFEAPQVVETLDQERVVSSADVRKVAAYVTKIGNLIWWDLESVCRNDNERQMTLEAEEAMKRIEGFFKGRVGELHLSLGQLATVRQDIDKIERVGAWEGVVRFADRGDLKMIQDAKKAIANLKAWSVK